MPPSPFTGNQLDRIVSQSLKTHELCFSFLLLTVSTDPWVLLAREGRKVAANGELLGIGTLQAEHFSAIGFKGRCVFVRLLESKISF